MNVFELGFGDGGLDALDIATHRMIGQMIDAPLPETLPESSPAIAATLKLGHFSMPAIGIDIHNLSGMAVAKPGRWHAGDNVIVMNPAVVFQLDVFYVSFVPNARAAKSMQFLGR